MIHGLETRPWREGKLHQSAMSESETNRSDRCADVHRGHNPFQPVVAGSVEEIAHTDDRYRLAGKVQSQSRSRAPEDANDRIQFLAAALQISAGHGKIGAIQSRRRKKKCPIFLIPEFVLKNDVL